MSAETIQSGVRPEEENPFGSNDRLNPEMLAELHKKTELYGIPVNAGAFCDMGEIQPGVSYLGDGTSNVAILAGPSVDYLDVCFTKKRDPEDEGVAIRSMLARSTEDPRYFVGSVPLSPGETYGLRAWGIGNPKVNHERLVVDPWARAIAGHVKYAQDGSPIVPECVVVGNEPYDWEGFFAPTKTYTEGEHIIYEAHVDGLTYHHPGVTEKNRGKYLGLAEQPITDHLSALGITHVELLPVQHSATELFQASRGFENEWGYNTLGFFAPDKRFASDSRPEAPVEEVRGMVKGLHKAGIGVIMDVVYNHTPEEKRPESSMLFNGLGLDIYHKNPDGSYTDYTGCGPDIDASKPLAQDVILDSITYWVQEIGVDGFRFDLASALARDGEEGKPPEVRDNWFMRRLKQHVEGLERQTGKRITLLFEPWDTQSDPVAQAFCEYGPATDDKPRDEIKRFARGESTIGQLAQVLVGATNVYPDGNLPAHLTLNYVTAHDGFTLQDLVSYNYKHNEPNGEKNRDGANNSLQWNHGVEGPTEDINILDARDRHRRAVMAFLALSRGIPMIRYGDELSHTQKGNNNSYCQKELNRLQWELRTSRDEAFLQFVQQAFRLRRGHGVLTATAPLVYAPVQPGRPNNLYWLNGNGDEMQENEWREHAIVGAYRSAIGSAVLAYFNTSRYDNKVHLPRDPLYSGGYIEVLNSANPNTNSNPLHEDDGVAITKDDAGRIRLQWKDEIDVPNLSAVVLEPRALPSGVNVSSAHSDEWWYGKQVTDLLDAAKRSTQPIAA